MSQTAVLALGGNALARAGEPATITNQFRHARESVAPIVQLAREGWRIAIVHGNGPQVGDELAATSSPAARWSRSRWGCWSPPLPVGSGTCSSSRFRTPCAPPGCKRDVVTVITQTVIDPYDPALSRPTKPIGHALAGGAARRAPGGRASQWGATAPAAGGDGGQPVDRPVCWSLA